MSENTRRRLSLFCNCFIAIMVPVAWCMMAFRDGPGQLTSRGLLSLRYFTVLSNLLCGAGSLLHVSFALRGTDMPRSLRTAKFAGVVSVGLTFLTVMVFLGPLFGYGGMFQGANLWFHLVIPLLAMAEFCLLDPHEPPERRDILWAALPMLVYGVGYLANILVNGVPGNDWYGFVMWGFPAGGAIFAVIIGLTCGIAALLRQAARRRNRKS